RRGRLHPCQLLRHLSAGGLPIHRARLRHRCPRRLRLHSRDTARRPRGGRGAERDHRVSPPRLQGRLRLRLLYPHRALPTSGTLWTVLAVGSARESPKASSCSWPLSIPSPSSSPATPISRRWASSSC